MKSTFKCMCTDTCGSSWDAENGRDLDHLWRDTDSDFQPAEQEIFPVVTWPFLYFVLSLEHTCGDLFSSSELKPHLTVEYVEGHVDQTPGWLEYGQASSHITSRSSLCYLLPHASVWGLFFQPALLAAVIFHVSRPLTSYPLEVFCWTVYSSWNDLPQKLWRNDHLNSDSVTVLLSQTVLIRVLAKLISTIFWSQICSYAFRRMAIFSFPFLIYLFYF